MKVLMLLTTILLLGACATTPTMKSVAGTYESVGHPHLYKLVFLENETNNTINSISVFTQLNQLVSTRELLWRRCIRGKLRARNWWALLSVTIAIGSSAPKILITTL